MMCILFFLFLQNSFAYGDFPLVVPSVDVNQYLGSWYQVYSDFAVQSTFENSSYCVTATYGINENNTISVLNQETQFGVNGPVRLIHGWAAPNNETDPSGALTVHLQTVGLGAPYWILQLGPIVNDMYDYSIVSDPFRFTLFVLARNITNFYQTYNETVLEWLSENGFTSFYNTPIETIQNGCSY